MKPVDYSLPKRWTPLRYHPEQARLIQDTRRFKTIAAGRRSGKTEIAKRMGVQWAIDPISRFDDPVIGFGAPTRAQAKRIFWRDLKALTPKWALAGKPSETELIITFKSGAIIQVVGLDEPARVEGSPWDHFFCDEFGNVRAKAWEENIRPALDDREGTAWLFGVPEGRNYYYDIDLKARTDTTGFWSAFHWKSADILPAHIIEQARRDLDPLTYQQEYEAAFITFAGRAYYNFSIDTHCKPLLYDPKQPLIFCLDFNTAPGIAVVAQEQYLPACFEVITEKTSSGIILSLRRQQVFGTGVIGEVYIERGSNTPMVCRKLVQDWGNHQGKVEIYGDATGGNGGSAKVQGSDWDLVKDVFKHSTLRDKVSYHIPRANPSERARVNAMNARIANTKGEIRLCVDPAKAPKTMRDLDGVQVVKGSAGELDKKSNPNLTHLSDALGYYVVNKFPTGGTAAVQTDF